MLEQKIKSRVMAQPLPLRAFFFFLLVAPYMWHPICGTLYVAPYMWHPICGALYVAPYIWCLISEILPVVVCVWHLIYGTNSTRTF